MQRVLTLRVSPPSHPTPGARMKSAPHWRDLEPFWRALGPGGRAGGAPPGRAQGPGGGSKSKTSL
eukprot:2135397-Pyramimonas_sp.AAC.2